MKREVYKYPRSAFLSTEKDVSIIVDLILKNENLKRLLYYTTNDCLDKPKLTEEQSFGLFGQNIRIVPKLEVNNDIKNYIIISFDDFVSNYNNPAFRDNTIQFDIICHFDCWNLKDFQLRPYRIAAEIDSMLNERRLTGIGKIEFLGAKQMLLTDEYAGLCLMYQTIHGDEDKKNALNPVTEQQIEDNFDEMFNL